MITFECKGIINPALVYDQDGYILLDERGEFLTKKSTFEVVQVQEEIVFANGEVAQVSEKFVFGEWYRNNFLLVILILGLRPQPLSSYYKQK